MLHCKSEYGKCCNVNEWKIRAIFMPSSLNFVYLGTNAERKLFGRYLHRRTQSSPRSNRTPCGCVCFYLLQDKENGEHPVSLPSVLQLPSLCNVNRWRSRCCCACTLLRPFLRLNKQVLRASVGSTSVSTSNIPRKDQFESCRELNYVWILVGSIKSICTSLLENVVRVLSMQNAYVPSTEAMKLC